MHCESAMLCKAQRNSERKTLKTSMSTGQREPCAEARQEETSCIKDAVYTKAANRDRGAYCRPWAPFCDLVLCRYRFQKKKQRICLKRKRQRTMNGENSKMPAWHESKVRSKQKRNPASANTRQNSSFCNAHGLVSFHKIQSWTINSRSTKGESWCVVMK